MNSEMLGSLLPQDFQAAQLHCVQAHHRPPASIKLLVTQMLHVMCCWPCCSLPHLLSLFLFFFFKFLPCVLSTPESFYYLLLLCNWSLRLSLSNACHSLLHTFVCVAAVSPLIQINILLLKDHGVFSLLALTVRTSDFKIYLKLYWYKNR